MPLGKGHLPVTETNRTGYGLGGSVRERAACPLTNRAVVEEEEEGKNEPTPRCATRTDDDGTGRREEDGAGHGTSNNAETR